MPDPNENVAPALILDRDGTLIHEKHYLSDPELVEIIEGSELILKRFQEAGWKLVCITNQSGVGRGYFGMESVDRVHERIQQILARSDVQIDQFYVSPHAPNDPDPLEERKPGLGLVRKAQAEFNLDLKRSWVIGDKPADLLMGKNAGCRTVLVRTGYGKETETTHSELADLIVVDLSMLPFERMNSGD